MYIVSTTAKGTSGDPKSVEWYAQYNEFSTFYYSAASEAIFAMQLFVKSGSATPTEPSSEPTEPSSEPTEPSSTPTTPTTPVSGEYKVAQSVAVGDKIILVAEYQETTYAMANDTSISNALKAVTVSVENDKVKLGEDDIVWEVVAGTVDGTFLLKNSSGKYISWSSGTTLKIGDTGANFTITCGKGTSSLLVSIDTANATKNRGLVFRVYNEAPQFRAYQYSNKTEDYSYVLTIYKLG